MRNHPRRLWGGRGGGSRRVTTYNKRETQIRRRGGLAGVRSLHRRPRGTAIQNTLYYYSNLDRTGERKRAAVGKAREKVLTGQVPSSGDH